MEKRVLIAVVLSFLVLYFYQAFLAPPPPKPKPKVAAADAGQTATPADATAAAAGVPAAAPTSASTAASGPTLSVAAQPTALVGDSIERDVVVETAELRVVFTNRGGRVRHWELKNFHDQQGRHVDLVPSNIAGAPLPFSLDTPDGALNARLNDSLYRVTADGQTGGRDEARTVSFEFRDSGGLQVKKSFSISAASFLVGVNAEATLGGTPVNLALALGPGLGDVQTSTPTSQAQKSNGVVFADGKVTRFDGKTIVAQPQQQGTWGFAGMDNHYFMSVALLDGKTTSGVKYRHYWVAKTPEKPEHDFVAYTLNPSGDALAVQVYLGPKSFSVLKALNNDLVRVINFGMFSWLAVPLLQALNGINAYIRNYGWSIIALTVLINLAIFPLRHKSFVSMRKMQAIQPEIKAVQERYGKLKTTDPDRQKMNTELMQLYRDRGVNPASGCVPILLTMPLLFAFYSLLSVAIELRGAPFMLWIKDLAVHDPWYVTPILMGITMVVQQKMTPSQGDPMQQKMMMLMPVVFTGMFLWAPSGLVVYWFVSNLLAIGQQYATNRMLAPITARDLRPAK